MHKLTQTDCSQYLTTSACRLLSIPTSVAVPQPSADVFRIDFVGDSDEVHVKWLGGLPSKCEYSPFTIRKSVEYSIQFSLTFRSRSAAKSNKSHRREVVHGLSAQQTYTSFGREMEKVK